MEKVNLNMMLKDIEREYVNKALAFCGNNIAQAAELLGLKRTSLSERLSSLGIVIQRPRKKYENLDDKQLKSNPILVLHKNNIEDDLWRE